MIKFLIDYLITVIMVILSFVITIIFFITSPIWIIGYLTIKAREQKIL